MKLPPSSQGSQGANQGANRGRGIEETLNVERSFYDSMVRWPVRTRNGHSEGIAWPVRGLRKGLESGRFPDPYMWVLSLEVRLLSMRVTQAVTAEEVDIQVSFHISLLPNLRLVLRDLSLTTCI